MRDRWRGLTSSSPAAIIHALHWAYGSVPSFLSARALPFQINFLFCSAEKKTKYIIT